MFKQLCKQYFPIILFRQPIFTSKTYSHAVTYNHASADSNLPLFYRFSNSTTSYSLSVGWVITEPENNTNLTLSRENMIPLPIYWSASAILLQPFGLRSVSDNQLIFLMDVFMVQ